MSLAAKKCLPCSGQIPLLSEEEIDKLANELPAWTIIDKKKLTRSFSFKNFDEAMQLAKKIADVAELEHHHPDLLVRWGELKVEIWTHKVDGLTESDFILAAKIDQCAAGRT